MKKIILLLISTLMTVATTGVIAKSEGRLVDAVNQSYNKANLTSAKGHDNLASTGAINIKVSSVKITVLRNRSNNKENAIVAAGFANTASNGSMTVE